MAYNKNNYLLRVKEVNETYKEYALKGYFNEYIYANFIKDRFHISRTTFYNYLTIPYERQLKQIQKRETAQQLSIF